MGGGGTACLPATAYLPAPPACLPAWPTACSSHAAPPRQPSPLCPCPPPLRPAERERITAAGGRVTRLATDRFGNPAGPFRVFVPNCWSPGLALSRAFGDTREQGAAAGWLGGGTRHTRGGVAASGRCVAALLRQRVPAPALSRLRPSADVLPQPSLSSSARSGWHRRRDLQARSDRAAAAGAAGPRPRPHRPVPLQRLVSIVSGRGSCFAK